MPACIVLYSSHPWEELVPFVQEGGMKFLCPAAMLQSFLNIAGAFDHSHKSKGIKWRILAEFLHGLVSFFKLKAFEQKSTGQTRCITLMQKSQPFSRVFTPTCMVCCLAKTVLGSVQLKLTMVITYSFLHHY